MCEECDFKILREITKGHRPGSLLVLLGFVSMNAYAIPKLMCDLHAFLGKGRCFQVQVCSSKLK